MAPFVIIPLPMHLHDDVIYCKFPIDVLRFFETSTRWVYYPHLRDIYPEGFSDTRHDLHLTSLRCIARLAGDLNVTRRFGGAGFEADFTTLNPDANDEAFCRFLDQKLNLVC